MGNAVGIQSGGWNYPAFAGFMVWTNSANSARCRILCRWLATSQVGSYSSETNVEAPQAQINSIAVIVSPSRCIITVG